MRYGGGEVMLHRIESRIEAANVEEIVREKVEGVIRTHKIITWNGIGSFVLF